ncbi:MAG: hypothetical protein OEY52_07715 [Gammaproteobacteria bacterium]|nr:hypothetical protein [Gammaproteobacteria bacterium]
MNTSKQTDPFYIAYRGAFTSLLKWPDLDAFWQILSEQADKGWYIYKTDEAVPEQVVSADELKKFIKQVDQYLHQAHDEDYCGIVYTDSKTEPTYIKIYDPNNLGVVCGIGREPIYPGWIISQLAPKSLQHLPPLRTEIKPWWRKFIPFG